MNPLKQGLKLNDIAEPISNQFVKEVNPLKQGLKPSSLFIDNLSNELVKEVNPLKQGLKHFYTSS